MAMLVDFGGHCYNSNMANQIHISDVLALPVDDRLRLVEEIWDSIAAVPESLVLTDAQREELDRRLAAHRRDPDQGSPWSEVKARLQQEQ